MDLSAEDRRRLDELAREMVEILGAAENRMAVRRRLLNSKMSALPPATW